MGLTAVNAWSWDFARNRPFRDLWNAIANFEWEAAPPVADVPESLLGRLNQHNPALVTDMYHENAAHVTGARTVVGREAIIAWYSQVFTEILPGSVFELTGKSGDGNSRHFTWTARGPRGDVLDGNDTIGIREGKIQYHYSYFNVV